VESAEEGGDQGALDAAVDRLLLAHAIVYGWGGIPVLWSGDELALPNDPHWAQEEGHGSDNRWAHRPRLPQDVAQRRHDPSGVAGRVFAGLRRLARARAALTHLDAAVPAEVQPLSDPGIFPVLRRHPVGPMLALYNVTASWRPWPGRRLRELGLDPAGDALTGRTVFPGDDGNFWLAPYQALWLVNPEALPSPVQSRVE
jgi:amylosucrase